MMKYSCLQVKYSRAKSRHYFLLICIFIFLAYCSCTPAERKSEPVKPNDSTITETTLLILGNVQDGGSPHSGCKKECCKDLFLNPDPTRKVVSLGLIDPENKKSFLFEATPDFTTQIKYLKNYCPYEAAETPDGILLTHAHIGHYTGLMYLGKEAMNSKGIPVYAMPRMKAYLEQNGPWSQLVKLNNIQLRPLANDSSITLTPSLKVSSIKVPHRDEYSETVGYIIEGPKKKVLFIPDIDKWEKWEKDIIEMIKNVDYAFIDGTFYDGVEINNRNIAEIPHPFIIESMQKFNALSKVEKSKIYFIHFNHTNPSLNENSPQTKKVLENGFNIARMGQLFSL